MRGAVVPYLYTLGFLRTFDKDVGICSSTLEPNNILYLSDYQIIHSIFIVI